MSGSSKYCLEVKVTFEDISEDKLKELLSKLTALQTDESIDATSITYHRLHSIC